MHTHTMSYPSLSLSLSAVRPPPFHLTLWHGPATLYLGDGWIGPPFHLDLVVHSPPTRPEQVVMAIEEEFALEIPDNEADKILSIEDAIKYVSGHPQAK